MTKKEVDKIQKDVVEFYIKACESAVNQDQVAGMAYMAAEILNMLYKEVSEDENSK